MRQLIELMTDAEDAPGRLMKTELHEHAADAVCRYYGVAAGVIIVTQWRGKVHEVIYQTPCEFVEDSEARNARLFEFYGDGHGWKEVLDNGFGKTYRREDMLRFALWSYMMDFVTFGTMDFHAVRWGWDAE